MLLTVENLSLSYDKKVLYSDASFRVLPNEKVGIVGSNGVGKTTLVEILSGKVIPDQGKINFDKNIKVGYLDQQAKINKKLSIKEYLQSAFVEEFKLYQEVQEILSQIEKERHPEILDRLVRVSSHLHERLEQKNFYVIDSEIAKIAHGLGIIHYGMDTALGRLSGGQKVKVILAKLLLENPDLLILDEPTNFLDTTHVDWLVKYLKEYKGSFLIVSHHQEFLNDVVNVILEVENGKITRYKGNYQDYLMKKAFRQNEYERQYLAQQKEISKLTDYISKNKVRAATAAQAKSRQKKLEKIEVLTKPVTNQSPLKLKFNYRSISSHKLLVINKLEIGYYYSLLPPISLELKSGEKLAITGFNGIGKTTLLKTLIGEIAKMGGIFKFVDDVKIAYFSQEHVWDDPKLTPLQLISNQWPKMDHKEIRAQLARCGITAGQALQSLGTLSGGEQSKVKLCLMMLKEANVLILDEPTNHLDAISKESLMKELKAYPGTVLFVSHERDFIKGVATRELNIEDLLV